MIERRVPAATSQELFFTNSRVFSESQRIELLRDVVALANHEESEWPAARFGVEDSAWLCQIVEFQAVYLRDYRREERFCPPHHDGLCVLENELGHLESYWIYFTAIDNNLVQAAACEHVNLVKNDVRKKIAACREEVERFNGALGQRMAWLLRTEMLR